MKLTDGYEIVGKYGSEMISYPEIFTSKYQAYNALENAEEWFDTFIGAGFNLFVKVVEKAVLDEV